MEECKNEGGACATAPAKQETLFDYRDLQGNDVDFVKERAVLIRDVAKKTAHAIVNIGHWLTEVKAKLPHGSWLPWLETEFGWTDRTALNFMRVFEMSKSETVSDLPIDFSALYLIAAPKTPEPVRHELIRRAEAGEPITKAKVIEAVDKHREPEPMKVEALEFSEQCGNRAEAPTPAVAGQIENDPPLSEEERLKREEEQYKRLRRFRKTLHSEVPSIVEAIYTLSEFGEADGHDFDEEDPYRLPALSEIASWMLEPCGAPWDRLKRAEDALHMADTAVRYLKKIVKELRGSAIAQNRPTRDPHAIKELSSHSAVVNAAKGKEELDF